MSHSAFLQYHQDLHSRAKGYCKRPVDPSLAVFRLKPLTAQGLARNGQSSLKWTIPSAQMAYTNEAQMNADYATWHLGNQTLM